MVVIESLLFLLTADRYISDKLSVSIHLIVIAEDMGEAWWVRRQKAG
jgi:hypothetical protein